MDKAVKDLKVIDDILDEYEQSIGLPKFVENFPSCEQYFKLTGEQIEKLTPADCASISIQLNALAVHVQRSYNREIARIGWAKNKLKSILSGKESNYSGSWDSQFYQAANDNDYTRKLLAIKAYAQQRADRLNFLSTAIQNRAQLFVNLQRAKEKL